MTRQTTPSKTIHATAPVEKDHACCGTWQDKSTDCADPERSTKMKGKSMKRQPITLAAMGCMGLILSASSPADAAILNSNFNVGQYVIPGTGHDSQNLTGYVANNADAGITLSGTYVQTLDWKAWGDDDDFDATWAMDGGSGIQSAFVVTESTGADFGPNGTSPNETKFTEVEWEWSDGASTTTGTRWHDVEPGDTGAPADAVLGMRLIGDETSTSGTTVDWVFDADPSGQKRAATLLIRLQNGSPSTLSAFVGSDTPVGIFTHTGESGNSSGLVTVEYDGTEDLTIRLTDDGDDTNVLFRGTAATLSTIPEPSSLPLLVLGAATFLRRRR
jgi:hypothetical protein